MEHQRPNLGWSGLVWEVHAWLAQAQKHAKSTGGLHIHVNLLRTLGCLASGKPSGTILDFFNSCSPLVIAAAM